MNTALDQEDLVLDDGEENATIYTQEHEDDEDSVEDNDDTQTIQQQLESEQENSPNCRFPPEALGNNNYESAVNERDIWKENHDRESNTVMEPVFSPGEGYKRRREANIKRNEARLAELGINNISNDIQSNKKIKKLEKKKQPLRAANRLEMYMKRMERQQQGHCKTLQDVKSHWPHREYQVKLLGRILESVSVTRVLTPRSIIVSGPIATGKTCVVRDVMSWVQAKYHKVTCTAFIDASLVVSTQDIFESALDQLCRSFLMYRSSQESDEEFVSKKNYLLRSSTTSTALFARKISILFGTSTHTIIAIDNAEELTTFRSKPIMSQLMRVARDMAIRVTIIAITTKSLWEKSHVSTSNQIDNVLEEMVIPMKINFPAYRDAKEFRDILRTSKAKKSITFFKTHHKNETYEKAYNAMIETLLQSLLSTTRDIREVMRLGRLLWPLYIQPLEEKNDTEVDNTLLDRKARPHVMYMLEHCLLNPLATLQMRRREQINRPSVKMIPRCSKFLMLAGFLCQYNREKEDLNLYTKQTNRKRRSRNAGKCSEQVPGTNIHRHRTFSQERMLSIFYTLIKDYTNDSIPLDGLGTSFLFRNIAHLCNLGYFVKPDTKVITMQDTKIVCRIPMKFVEEIANDVGFPLEKYLR